jgi:hypothetical protein
VRLRGDLSDETRLSVAAEVLPMASLATPGLERSFAAALDSLTPLAEGHVSRLIVRLQALETAEAVAGAIHDLAPRMPAMSIGSAGAAIDAGLAALGGGSAGGFAAPGLHMVRAGSPTGGWAASFEGVVGAGGAGGRGLVSGIASGTALALGEGARLQFGVVRQFGSHQVAGSGGSGQSRSMLVAAELRSMPASGAEVGLRLAAGRHAFAGGRALPDGAAPEGAARLDQESRLLAAEASASVALPFASGWRLQTGISHRSAKGEASREAGPASGLSLIVDRASYLRNQGWIALAAAPEWRLRIPGYLDAARLAARVSTGWTHQFNGSAERLTARFADMPGRSFDLLSSRAPRDALTVDVSLALEPVRGPRVLLGMQQRPDDTGLERAARVSLDWRF